MTRTLGVKAKVDRAALDLFAARGVDGVSIAEIAAAAGVSQGALYRHYAGKDDLAASLFNAAYLGMAAELDRLRAGADGFGARLAAMIAHFCAVYDDDAALFRFMLLAQHAVLPHLGFGQPTPVDIVADIVTQAVRDGELAPVDPDAAAAAILGIVLQTAVFHVYGRLSGKLRPRAAGLAAAASAAVAALGRAGA